MADCEMKSHYKSTYKFAKKVEIIRKQKQYGRENQMSSRIRLD